MGLEGISFYLRKTLILRGASNTAPFRYYQKGAEKGQILKDRHFCNLFIIFLGKLLCDMQINFFCNLAIFMT